MNSRSLLDSLTLDLKKIIRDENFSEAELNIRYDDSIKNFLEKFNQRHFGHQNLTIAQALCLMHSAEFIKNSLDANANKIIFTITMQNDSLSVKIQDDGKGFKEDFFQGEKTLNYLDKLREKNDDHIVASIPSQKEIGQTLGGNGVGLARVCEQVNRLNGQLLIHKNSSGSTIEISAPKKVMSKEQEYILTNPHALTPAASEAKEKENAAIMGNLSSNPLLAKRKKDPALQVGSSTPSSSAYSLFSRSPRSSSTPSPTQEIISPLPQPPSPKK